MQQIQNSISPYAPLPATASTRSFDAYLVSFVGSLRRHWALSLLIFSALFIPMAIVSMQQPTLHRAESKILFENDARINLEMSTALAAKDRERILPPEKMNSQAEVIKSATLLLDLIRELGLADNEADERAQLERLKRQISVRVIPTSSVISVSYADTDPQRARDVVNTLTQIYLGYYMRLVEGEDPVKLYQTQFDLADSALQRNMDAYRSLQAELGIVDSYTVERGRLSTKLEQLDTALAEAGVTLAKAKQTREILSRQLAAAAPTVRLSTETVPNPEAQQLTRDLAALLSQRDAQLTRYTAQHREVQRTESEIAALRARLQQVPRNMTGKSSDVANPQHTTLLEQLAQVEIEIGQLDAARARFEEEKLEAQQLSTRLDREEFQLKSLEDAIAANTKARQLYHSKLTDARLVDAMNRADILSVNVIETAMTASPSSSRLETLAASFLLAVVVALGVVLLLDWRTPRVQSPEQLRSILGVPGLATLPNASKDRPMLEHLRNATGNAPSA